MDPAASFQALCSPPYYTMHMGACACARVTACRVDLGCSSPTRQAPSPMGPMHTISLTTPASRTHQHYLRQARADPATVI